jgi:pimeloyl-ACP methyl ester carboxylesterase
MRIRRLGLVAVVAFGFFSLALADGAGIRLARASQENALPRKAYVGIRMAPLPDEIRAREQLGSGSGVLIEAVSPGTAGAEGGIRPGDVLLDVGGKAISGVADAMMTIATMQAGQKVEVTLLRAGRRFILPVTLKERPRDRGETFDVLYDHVVSGAARIRTIVTKPHRPGRHPVLFLIQGLGLASIDAPLSGPEPYSRILNEFAKSDYVTVRVEKPGIGDSEGGPPADLDFETELDAYRQALLEVRNYAFVDADNVFIFGHSMGGVFGPIIASEGPIKGIAVYGAIARTTTEYFLENRRRQAVLAGEDPAQIDSTLRGWAVALHYVLMEQKSPADILRARPDLRPALDVLSPYLAGRAVSFWSQLAARNLPAYWAKGNAHVLALWGKNDFIATEADHPLIIEVVDKARPGKGTYIPLENSDHRFRKTSSMEDSFKRWLSPGEEFNPQIITTLKDWIEKVQRAN